MKKRLLFSICIFSFLLSFNLKAQNPLCFNGISSADSYSMGSVVFPHLESADLNNDGYQDIVCRSTVINNVAIHYGNASGIYNSTVNYNVGNIYVTTITDINNDGILDIVFASGSGLGTLLGNISGTFNAPIFSIVSIGITFRLLTGDFNGDGLKDIYTNTSSGSSVYFGNGAGNFTNSSMSNSYGGLNPDISTKDLNADGKTDALTVTGNSVIACIVDPYGVQFSPVNVYTLTATPSSGSLINKDFNNDGKLDAVTCSSLGVHVMFGSGSGSFSAPVNYLALGNNLNSITDGDFNNDGFLDLAVTNYNLKTITTLTNNGSGVFSGATNYMVGAFSSNIKCKDINNDGNVDLIGFNYDHVFRLLGNGTGGFSPATYFSGGNINYLNNVLDYNNDGNPDVAVLDNNINLTLVRGKGNGDFYSSENILSRDNTGGDFINTDDYNNDGKQDIAVLDDDSATITIYTGNNAGKFTKATRFNTSLPWDFVSADFNGDTYKDIAVTGGSGTLIYLGSVSGTFTYLTSYPIGGDGIEKGDFNGDGIMDLVVTNISNYQVWKLMGNGNGTFATSFIYSIFSSCPRGVIARDFNNDSKLDIAVANYCNTNLAVSLGNGSGGFAAPVTYTFAFQATDLRSADFNGDGNLDIAVTNYGAQNVSVLMGSSSGTFGAATSYTVGNNPLTLAVGDFNGDGKPDIAASVFNGTYVQFLLGNGAGTFSVAAKYYLERQSRGIATADFNNDGALDLVSPSIGILLSNTPSITVNSLNTACIGSTISLNASGSNSYTWTPSGSGPTIFVSPTVTTTYTVIGTNALGCASSAIKTISVNPIAASNITVTGSNTLCSTSSTTLNASGLSTYTWSTSSNNSSITITPTVSTTYTVFGHDSNACPNTAFYTVTVMALPNIAITGTNIACSGKVLTYTASGAPSFTWSTGAIANTISLTAVTNTVYSATALGITGCYRTVSYSLVTLPTPTLMVTGSTSACAGSIITLTASGAVSYTWDSGATTPTVAYTPTLNIYILYGSNNNTCSVTVSAPITIMPTPTLYLSGGGYICPGKTTTLSVFGAVNYTWAPGPYYTSSVIITPTVQTNYTLTGEDANGCISSNTLNVFIASTPTITVNSVTPVCVGNTVTLTASGGSTPFSYTWTPGPFAYFNIVTTPTATTTYTVIGDNYTGCQDTTTLLVIVNPLPTLNVTSSNSVLCVGQTATLTTNGANTYTWSTSTIGSTEIVTPSSNTNYTVTGTDVNNCIGTTIFTQSVSSCTGINNLVNNTSGIFIFPNPTNGLLNFHFNSVTENTFLELYNQLGELVLKEKISDIQYEIDLNEFSSGIYQLLVTENKTIIRKEKIIKQ